MFVDVVVFVYGLREGLSRLRIFFKIFCQFTAILKKILKNILSSKIIMLKI